MIDLICSSRKLCPNIHLKLYIILHLIDAAHIFSLVDLAEDLKKIFEDEVCARKRGFSCKKKYLLWQTIGLYPISRWSMLDWKNHSILTN